MNERLDIKKELKRKFSKITLDYCGHLLENHINKTDEQLQRRLKDNRNLRVASSFYGEKSQIMQTIFFQVIIIPRCFIQVVHENFRF